MYFWHSCPVRADRLLSLMLLLSRRGRMTATELSRELECSVRTVLRDIDALSTAGVPVFAERGRRGGFALLDGFSTDLTGLTHAEAAALFVAGSRATSASLGMAPALASAMRKLSAAMPEPQRLSAERAGQRVLVQPQGWLGEPEPTGMLPVIQQAVFADRRLKIRYTTNDEPARWRTIDPVGLVHAAGRWYLLATHRGADRTYRVSRVSDATILDQPADRRAGIDLQQAWQERRQAFRHPGFAVRARVRAARRGQLVRAALSLTAETAGTDDWLFLDLVFADQRHAAAVLWSLAPDADVVQPSALQDALTTRAEQALRQYHCQ